MFKRRLLYIKLLESTFESHKFTNQREKLYNDQLGARTIKHVNFLGRVWRRSIERDQGLNPHVALFVKPLFLLSIELSSMHCIYARIFREKLII